MAPLALALVWRRGEPDPLVRLSALAALAVVAAMFLNLSPLFAPDLYPFSYYGVVQRSLFVAFYGWCAVVGIALSSRA